MVPLFGDMMTVPFSYIEMSPNFDATKWPQCLSEQPSAQTQLVKQLPLVRQQYIQLVCELTLLCGATKELAKPPKKVGCLKCIRVAVVDLLSVHALISAHLHSESTISNLDFGIHIVSIFPLH